MRDPRIDPQPGDVLRKAGKAVRIHQRDDKYVYFDRLVDGAYAPAGRMQLDVFREFGKDAEEVEAHDPQKGD